ncbi:energy transducer TonB [Cognatilysobacter bugurensis]|uniref:TonB C-terminal domain-containing protein n=1 Tax=Cognatilysobacter bugurensis TaxID=543356 RepID=A0A918W8U1_9GAMM|nr:energy transducer TonB [Lysobacter bugurensis]GHA77513.1 hypothetical protein GCM10007067_13710 [Lysobacter bugurensis]
MTNRPCAAFAAALVSAVCLPVFAQDASRDEAANEELLEESIHWDEAPKFKRARGLPPLFPMSYIHGHKSGWAVMTYTVGVDGKARNVVLESSSDSKFGKHVAAAIQVWPHFPAVKDGTRVEATVTRRFELEF